MTTSSMTNLLLVASVAFSALPLLAAAQPNTGYSLVATVGKKTFAPSEPVKLQLSLKNTGQNAIPVLRAAPLRFHEIQLVHLATKQRVGLTKRGEQMQRASQEGSLSAKPLKPGETATSEIENLAELFDLGAPGEYSLTVSRKVFSHDDPQTTIFVSAPVQYITIVTKDR